jgi:hypothetical protein
MSLDNRMLRDGETLLLARINQLDDTHHELKHLLFSATGITQITNYVNDPEITTANGEIIGNITEQDTQRHNLRILTFYVDFTFTEEPYFKVYIIPTQQMIHFYAMNLIPLHDNPYVSSLIEKLTQKLLYELKILGYTLGEREPEITEMGTDTRPNHLIVNIDVYYNRGRENAGVFHQDRLLGSTRPGDNPLYVSLEFFMDPTIISLGPEAIIRPENYGTADRYDDDELVQTIQSRATNINTEYVAQSTIPSYMSMRTLIKDGTITMFNNLEIIHATPFTEAYPSSREPRRLINPIIGFGTYRRAERRISLTPIVTSTQTTTRSFLRMWFAEVPYTIDESCLEIPTDLLERLLEINRTELTVHPTQPLTLEQIAGASNQIELTNFVIFGNANKPNIKINVDVPYDDIKGIDNIKKYQEIESKFLNAYLKQVQILKKGGKRKTKKSRKRKSKKRKSRKTKRKSRKTKRKSRKTN